MNSVLVEEVDGFEHQPEQSVDLFSRKFGPFSVSQPNLFRERPAFDKGHRDVGGPQVFEPSEQPDDAGVIQSGDRSGLFSEIRHGPGEEFDSFFPGFPRGHHEGSRIAIAEGFGQVLFEYKEFP